MRLNRECSGEWLLQYVYGKRLVDPRVLKAHIWQLRQAGYPIHGTTRGNQFKRGSRYEWRDW